MQIYVPFVVDELNNILKKNESTSTLYLWDRASNEAKNKLVLN